MVWNVTNCKKAKSLCALLRRRGTQAIQRAADVYVLTDGRKPWAEISGYMTTETQVLPVPADAAINDEFDWRFADECCA